MEYKFKCNKCDISFALVFQGFFFTNRDIGVVCPNCRESTNVTKVWTVPQIIFRGTGWSLKGNHQVKND
jgi:predicted nucleic acid-binding Zn ribbon protein